MPQTIVVLGARNLGGAIIDHFLALGWNAAGVARSEETLDRVRTAGAHQREHPGTADEPLSPGVAARAKGLLR